MVRFEFSTVKTSTRTGSPRRLQKVDEILATGRQCEIPLFVVDQRHTRFCRLTMRISDPAPLTPDMKPTRYRGVHCIRLVRFHRREIRICGISNENGSQLGGTLPDRHQGRDLMWNLRK